MPRISPTAEGFRTVFRRPSFALAEITWRWVFGGAATLLLCFSVYEYLRTLPVTNGDLLFLRTRHPILVSQAIAHILAGSARRFVEALLIAVPCLAIFWIAAASFGRAATLRPLLEYFQTEAQAKDDLQRKLPLWHGVEAKPHFSALVGLNFLRVALALAAAVGLLGAVVIAGFVSPKSNPSPGLAFVIFLAIGLIVGTIWSLLNWVLSLAPIFVVRDAQDAFGALGASLDFFRERTAAVMWSSTAFGLIHMVVFVIASSVVFVPTMFLGIVPPVIVLAAVLLLTLVYFAIVDCLYMGRLAAYVCILECPPAANTAAISFLVPPDAPTLVSATSDPYTPLLFPPANAEVSSAINVPDSPTSRSSTAAESIQPSPGASQNATPVPSSDEDIVSDVPGLIPPDNHR